MLCVFYFLHCFIAATKNYIEFSKSSSSYNPGLRDSSFSKPSEKHKEPCSEGTLSVPCLFALPPETKPACVFNNVEYNDGDMFRLDKCRFCRCQGGVAICFTAQCGELNCERYYVPKGECCPVCEGEGCAPERGIRVCVAQSSGFQTGLVPSHPQAEGYYRSPLLGTLCSVFGELSGPQRLWKCHPKGGCALGVDSRSPSPPPRGIGDFPGVLAAPPLRPHSSLARRGTLYSPCSRRHSCSPWWLSEGRCSPCHPRSQPAPRGAHPCPSRHPRPVR